MPPLNLWDAIGLQVNVASRKLAAQALGEIMMANIRIVAGFWILALPGLGQPPNEVRISGRIVSTSGTPGGRQVLMSEIVPGGLTAGMLTNTRPDGSFQFTAVSGKRYRIYLGPGMTGRATVDTSGGVDVDAGDIVSGRCPASALWYDPPPLVPPELREAQIAIEKQEAWKGISPDLVESALKAQRHAYLERAPCWNPPPVPDPTSIGSFVGGKVKSVRVTRYAPKLTSRQIKDEVLKVWRKQFRYAWPSIFWSEPNPWHIEAVVEDEDGSSSTLLMDGWIHVCVRDRWGATWYIRE